MSRTQRVCSYCHEEMEKDEFKCKACGNLVTTKTAQPGRPQMTEHEETTLDRYSIVLLVLIAIVLPPVAIAIGGVILFSDDPYKRDTGKMLVTGAFVILIIMAILFIAGSGTLTINF